MRGQTKSDRRSLSKSIFRLEYISVGTDYILLVYVYYRVLKWSSAPEAQVYYAAETQGWSSLRGERNRYKYRFRGTEWRESTGDNTQDTNGDYQVQSCRDAEMSWRTRVD